MIKGKKILFMSPDSCFINSYIELLKEHNEVKEYNKFYPQQNDLTEISQLLQWADIAFFEWASEQLMAVTSFFPKYCPIVCRLHSGEYFAGKFQRINWSFVDTLIYVNKSIKDLINERQHMGLHQVIIPNYINFDKFKFNPSKSKKIASVGNIDFKKNPILLLHCFEKIHRYFPDYTLHIAGKFEEMRVQIYFQDYVKKNNLPVFVEGWTDNILDWYKDKAILLHTSMFEGFGMTILESMALGIYPIIHNWYGVDNIFPQDIIFNTVDDCFNKFSDFVNYKESKQRELLSENLDAVQKYSTNVVFEQLNKELEILL